MVNGDVLATTTTTSSSRPFGAHGNSSSSSSSGGIGGRGGFPHRQPHTIRAGAMLFSSASAEPHTPPGHPTTPGLSRLHSTSNTHSSSSSSVARSRTLRRLQHRSSSLLAATSATASSVWSSLSALGDRSRSLLCRNTPVAHSSSSSSNGSSGGDIGGVDEGAVGVGVFMPMAPAVGIERDTGAGSSSSSSTAGSSSFTRVSETFFEIVVCCCLVVGGSQQQQQQQQWGGQLHTCVCGGSPGVGWLAGLIWGAGQPCATTAVRLTLGGAVLCWSPAYDCSHNAQS